MSPWDYHSHSINLTVLAVICGLVFFLFLGKVPFHDKGEPREALVVRDIVDHGNWLFPLKLGQDIPSKPPLFHWIGAISSRFWGAMTEATIRFPSALFATLGVFLVYYLGARLYDQETGFFAGLMLATTVVYQSAAVEARVDMTLLFFITLSLVLFFAKYRGFLRSELWWHGFFIVTGAGVLAKGPVSLILCGLIIVSFLAARRNWELFWKLLTHPGIISGLAIFVIWYGLALWKGGGEFAGLQLVKENFARFFIHGEGGTGHQKPIYYFILYLFSLGFPWTMFLPLVLWNYFKRKCFTDERSLFLGIWIVVVLGFFSLSAGKRPPYILPLYPPLVLLVAVWCRLHMKEAAGAVKWIGWFAGGMGVVILLLLAGHVAGLDVGWLLQSFNVTLKPKAAGQLEMAREMLAEKRPLVSAVLFAAGLLWLLLARDLVRQKINLAVIQIAVLAVFTVLVVQGVVAPVLASARSYKEFVQLAKRKTGHREPLLLFMKGLDSSSIVFYGGAKIQLLNNDLQALRQRLEQSGDYVILGEQQWQALGLEPSLFPPLLRSRGRGPDGVDPLVLIQGIKRS
jgi:4-amino-4-deoxy-L-arabinose transferase-like glycosyltransferase